jgi:hypothetical protein
VTTASVALGLLILAIAWGAFAFGAVYPWAYWPLAVAAQMVAVLGLAARTPAEGRGLGLTKLSLALALFIAAGAVQLIPMSDRTVHALSPEASGIVSQLDLGPLAQAGVATAHPLSIAPRLTVTGLAVIASLALLVIGAARLLSLTSTRGLAKAITVIGVLLALTGIVQQPLFTGKIYGFWTPLMGGNPYGPFVNKNHFAGWMLMGLPITLGLIGGGVARGIRGARSGFRERLLWFASPDASDMLLLMGAALIMALSLVLTMSRSGLSAAILAIGLTSLLSLRKQDTLTKKIFGAVLVSAVIVIVVAWVGPAAIAANFAAANWNEINARRGPWEDAIGIIRLYPLVGTGLNTYGVATLFYQHHDLAQHYAQAHNDYLQLAAEGGLLLVVPAALCAAAFILAVRRRFRQESSVTTYWIRAGAVTGIAAMALQETVEFSLQMPGNAFLFAILCAMALHRTAPRPASRVVPGRV